MTICRELRVAGYQIALDDFIDEPELFPLVELSQFLKIDFQKLDAEAAVPYAAMLTATEPTTLLMSRNIGVPQFSKR